ncbi:MAG: dicarboxylate/amino acid:cation symporter [Lachnospiraceae bacterium]|nr:dicarboxylate/amino acid:cation symporter [Lachnospiraceae bacterium]
METRKEKRRLHFSVKVMIGLLLGIIAGIAFQWKPDIANTYIKPFGNLYLNAIKMLIVPLVFSSIVMGACGLGDVKKFGRIGLKTMAVYMVTTFFAAAIGVILANLANIGHGLELATGQAVEVSEAPNIIDTIINIIPGNPIKAMADGNMLQIIAFALFIGAGIVMVGKKAQPVMDFFDGFADIMYKITDVIMKFTPYAVFALICPTIASNGMDVLLPLLSFVLVVWFGFLIHLIFVYFTGIKVLVKMGPMKFIKAAWEAIVVSFTTCSSSATLPVTMECGRKLGISLPVRSFTLPLGATVNMDGGAIYQGITAVFVANLFGIHLTISQQIMIVATAVLASVGTAGVAGASIIMLGTVLSSVGLPLEGIAIVAGVDKLIDMPRTSINIIGDLMCSAFVARTEGELDMEAAEAEQGDGDGQL